MTLKAGKMPEKKPKPVVLTVDETGFLFDLLDAMIDRGALGDFGIKCKRLRSKLERNLKKQAIFYGWSSWR